MRLKALPVEGFRKLARLEAPVENWEVWIPSAEVDKR